MKVAKAVDVCERVSRKMTDIVFSGNDIYFSGDDIISNTGTEPYLYILDFSEVTNRGYFI